MSSFHAQESSKDFYKVIKNVDTFERLEEILEPLRNKKVYYRGQRKI